MSNRRKLTSSTVRPPDDPMLKACAELLPRLGASSFEVRYSEPEHKGSPVVWMAIADFKGHQPQVQAALSPTIAAYRLVEDLVDGGRCTHCQRPTGVTDNFDEMPANELVCWYQFDPELQVFRRGCA